MKTFRKIAALVTCAFVLMAGLFVPSKGALADEENNLALDLVLVIDQSNSMYRRNATAENTQNDPKGLRMDAAGIMLSMCDYRDSRAAVVLFSNGVKQSGWVFMNDISLMTGRTNRADLVKYLEGQRRETGANTDIGTAMEKAVEVLLASPDRGHKKTILLLTDGSIDIATGNKKDTERESISREKLAKAAQDCRDNGIDLRILHLSTDSSTKAADEIYALWDLTGVEVTNVTSAEQLPGIFNEIFAETVGSKADKMKVLDAEDGSQYVEIDIPNHSVTEANIVIPTKNGGKKITDIALWNPDGEKMGGMEDNIFISKTNNFSMYKIISPEVSGIWRLTFRDPDGLSENGAIQVVFGYDMDIEVTSPAKSVPKGTDITLHARYVKDGGTVKDEALYRRIPARAYLRNEEGKIVTNVEATPVLEGEMGYDFVIGSQPTAGKYTVTVTFQGDGLDRTSEPMELEWYNEGPVVNGKSTVTSSATVLDPNNPDTSDTKTMVFPLNDYFTDTSGEALRYTIQEITGDIEAVIKRDKLEVTNKVPSAKGTVIVRATDMDGDSADITFQTEFTDASEKYRGYTATATIGTGEAIGKNQEIPLTISILDEDGRPISTGNAKMLPDEITVTVGRTDVTLTRGENGDYTGTIPGQSVGGQVTVTIPAITLPTLGTVQVSGAATATFTVENAAPAIIGKAAIESETAVRDPADPSSQDTASVTFALGDHFSDSDDSTLKYAVTSVSGDVTASTQGSTLTVTNNTPGAIGKVTVTATDPDGSSASKTFTVTFRDESKSYEGYTAHVSIEGSIVPKQQDIPVVVTITDSEGKAIDAGKAALLPEEITITAGGENVTLKKAEGGKYEGTIPAKDKAGTVSIEVPAVTLPGMAGVTVAEKAEASFTVANQPPIVSGSTDITATAVVNNPDDPTTAGETFVTFNLSDYFMDQFGSSLAYAISSTEGDISATITDGVLKIANTAPETTGKVTVTATNSDGDTVSATFTVNFQDAGAVFDGYHAEFNIAAGDIFQKYQDIAVEIAIVNDNMRPMPEEKFAVLPEKVTITADNEEIVLTKAEGSKYEGTIPAITTSGELPINVPAITMAGVGDREIAPVGDISATIENHAPEYTAPVSSVFSGEMTVEPLFKGLQKVVDTFTIHTGDIAKDQDGDPLQVAIGVEPMNSGLTAAYDSDTGDITISATKPGDYTISISVTDTEGVAAVPVTGDTANGNTIQMTVHVKSVRTATLIRLLTLLGIIIAVVLAVVIVLIATKPRYPKEEIRIYRKGTREVLGTMPLPDSKDKLPLTEVFAAISASLPSSGLDKMMMKPSRTGGIQLKGKTSTAQITIGEDEYKGSGKLTDDVAATFTFMNGESVVLALKKPGDRDTIVTDFSLDKKKNRADNVRSHEKQGKAEKAEKAPEIAPEKVTAPSETREKAAEKPTKPTNQDSAEDLL